MFNLEQLHIAIIGLGYVGLPLAVEFGKKYRYWFRYSSKRIDELNNGQDHTLEVSKEEIQQAFKLRYTSSLEDLKDCNFL